MAANPLGKTLDQSLALYQATQVTREARIDAGGQAYESLRATLPDGGKLEGKIVPAGAGQLSWFDVYEANGQRAAHVTFGANANGANAKAGLVDTFQRASADPTAALTRIVTEWDNQGDGVPDGRAIWDRGLGWHTETDPNNDGVIDTVGPKEKK